MQERVYIKRPRKIRKVNKKNMQFENMKDRARTDITCKTCVTPPSNGSRKRGKSQPMMAAAKMHSYAPLCPLLKLVFLTLLRQQRSIEIKCRKTCENDTRWFSTDFSSWNYKVKNCYLYFFTTIKYTVVSSVYRPWNQTPIAIDLPY